MRHALTLSLSLAFWLVPASGAQEVKPRPDQPARAALLPNSDPTYQALRKAGLSGETVSVANFTLKRDAGVFTFRSGTFAFLAPVNGKVTGAVFLGDGSFTLVPPIASEGRVLALLTKEPKLEETFDQLVLRFTDSTYEEIRKAGKGTGTAPGNAAGLLDDINAALRNKLHYNLHARLLEDVLSLEPGGAFFAFIKGKKYNGKLLYAIDPHGLAAVYRDFPVRVAPEEIALLTWDDQKLGVWTSFHYTSEYATGKDLSQQQNAAFQIDHQQLDTRVEKSGRLSGTATTTIVSQVNGLRVLTFDLYRTLRVQFVTDDSGQPLNFVQEDKDEDATFAVILPKPLPNGEKFVIKTTYSGKDVIHSEGGGNYYPIPAVRDSWYPNSHFGDYATYHITFRVPKGLKMVATGDLVRDITEGEENLTEWRSEVPQAVAGFNFGKFKWKQAKMEKPELTVESYANEVQPDALRLLAQLGTTGEVEERTSSLGGTRIWVSGVGATGTLSTTSLMEKALAEAQLATQIYTDYFGPISYKRLAMTQQTDLQFIYGQAWPGLVYLPIVYFFDSTARHALRLDDPKGYFKVVGPHEVAHQWWGHTVGFNSYRDQWMSEGFAELSASIFLQSLSKDPKDFIKFWADELELLTQRNAEGYRAIDVGPVTLGYRLATHKSGFDIPRRLIYPKGGYILHMIRMMMWSPQTGDEKFKAMMREFVRSYSNRAATTEDFKRVVEKHMLQDMDVRASGKMDWFFDTYVYGTALPNYKLEHSFEEAAGATVLKVKITQSNVDPNFAMIVPLYLELKSGRVMRLGTAALIGVQTIEQKIPLRGLPEKPKRAMLNYFNDVLCTMEK